MSHLCVVSDDGETGKDGEKVKAETDKDGASERKNNTILPF